MALVKGVYPSRHGGREKFSSGIKTGTDSKSIYHNQTSQRKAADMLTDQCVCGCFLLRQQIASDPAGRTSFHKMASVEIYG
jgi:hypothetical protein